MGSDKLLTGLLTEAVNKMEESGPITVGQFKALEYYLTCAYGYGFDEGRTEYQQNKKVIAIDDEGEEHEFDSSRKAATELNLDSSSIRRGIKFNWKIGGYKWKYA